MGRSKVKLERIKDSAKRRITFKKRKNCLLKKVKELSTLCEVRACAIIYEGDEEKPPETWPSSQLQVRHVLGKFYNLSEREKFKKLENIESLNQRKVMKEKSRLEKLESQNKWKEMNLLMEQLHFHGKSLQDVNSVDDLNFLHNMIELKEKEIESRIDSLIKSRNVFVESSMSSLSRFVLRNPNTLVTAAATSSPTTAPSGGLPSSTRNTTNVSTILMNYINDIENGGQNLDELHANYNNFNNVGGVQKYMVLAPQMQLQPAANMEVALRSQRYSNTSQYMISNPTLPGLAPHPRNGNQMY